MTVKLIMAGASAAACLAACSASDLAYLTESGTYPDQTLANEYLQCPTGTIVLEKGIRGGESYDRAINRTEHRIMVNFQSRFGGGNQFYANPGQATETLWRSPVDANGTQTLYQCEGND
jgi:hypothetical protein